MKKISLLWILCLSVQHGYMQHMPSSTRHDFNILMELGKHIETIQLEDYASFPVYEMGGQLYLSLFGTILPDAQWQVLEGYGVIPGSITGNIATLKVPVQNLSTVPFHQFFSYLEIPARIAPHLHKVIKDVRADSVQQGINLPQGFIGSNVLIGITDWGFDYTQPMFYDTLLQQTRIVAAWDHYKQSGEHPVDFTYGVEYNTVDELMSAGSDTANVYSYSTHGTHVGGIAGGSGAGTQFRGMAPGAGFLFCTFYHDAASVLDAFHWMQQKAIDENKRLVVNMSWGLYYIGTQDGNSLLSQAIDQLSEEGVVFVSSAGNNGNNNFHIKKTFDNDVMTTRIAFDSYANPVMWGESITMWGEPAHPFETKLMIYNGVGTLLGETPMWGTAYTDVYVDSLLVINTDDTIWYNLSAEDAHPQNGRPHMRLRVKNTNTQLYVVLHATAPNGMVHFWNLVELTNGVGNWGLSFFSYGTTGMGGNSQYSIGEPACTASVIAVGSYEAEWYTTGGIYMGGDLSSYTSTGPLMTEVMKPDIAAPGENVVSSISHFTDYNYSQFDDIVFNEIEYDFAKMSGTSMASPCVTGIVALMLDANPNLTAQQVKQILQATARQDDETGVLTIPPGHPRWGHGKVNAYAAVQMALTIVDVQEEQDANSTLKISPNPTNDYINISGLQEHEAIRATAIAMDGKRITLSVEKHRVDCGGLAAGVYVMEIVTEMNTQNTRIVIN
ncbi:MAG: S8 family peptidase [Flavobacteriales bacterium]